MRRLSPLYHHFGLVANAVACHLRRLVSPLILCGFPLWCFASLAPPSTAPAFYFNLCKLVLPLIAFAHALLWPCFPHLTWLSLLTYLFIFSLSHPPLFLTLLPQPFILLRPVLVPQPQLTPAFLVVFKPSVLQSLRHFRLPLQDRLQGFAKRVGWCRCRKSQLWTSVRGSSSFFLAHDLRQS